MTERELNRIARNWARRLGDERNLKVTWNPRMRSLAGTADFGSREIALNERLLRRLPKETLSTLAHEVCHLTAGSRAGHGEKWSGAMKAIGFPPETEHTLDVSHLMQRRRRWLWRCRRCQDGILRSHTAAHRFQCACGGSFTLAHIPPRPARGQVSIQKRGRTISAKSLAASRAKRH